MSSNRPPDRAVPGRPTGSAKRYRRKLRRPYVDNDRPIPPPEVYGLNPSFAPRGQGSPPRGIRAGLSRLTGWRRVAATFLVVLLFGSLPLLIVVFLVIHG